MDTPTHYWLTSHIVLRSRAETSKCCNRLAYGLIYGAMYELMYEMTYESMYELMYEMTYESMYELMYEMMYEAMYEQLYEALYEALYKTMYEPLYEAMYKMMYGVCILLSHGIPMMYPDMSTQLHTAISHPQRIQDNTTQTGNTMNRLTYQ